MSVDNTIDGAWITELKDELNSDIFYKEDVENINIVFIYLDDGNIIHIKKTKQRIANHCITEHELYKLMLDNKYLHNFTFYINTIIKYNFTLEPDALTEYDIDDDNDYLTEHTPNSAVSFEPSIKIFEPLNTLYVIMNTKKSNNKTRRIYITPSNKKTRRKY
jgi:hypothetical protein